MRQIPGNQSYKHKACQKDLGHFGALSLTDTSLHKRESRRDRSTEKNVTCGPFRPRRFDYGNGKECSIHIAISLIKIQTWQIFLTLV